MTSPIILLFNLWFQPVAIWTSFRLIFIVIHGSFVCRVVIDQLIIAHIVDLNNQIVRRGDLYAIYSVVYNQTVETHLNSITWCNQHHDQSRSTNRWFIMSVSEPIRPDHDVFDWNQSWNDVFDVSIDQMIIVMCLIGMFITSGAAHHQHSTSKQWINWYDNQSIKQAMKHLIHSLMNCSSHIITTSIHSLINQSTVSWLILIRWSVHHDVPSHNRWPVLDSIAELYPIINQSTYRPCRSSSTNSRLDEWQCDSINGWSTSITNCGDLSR